MAKRGRKNEETGRKEAHSLGGGRPQAAHHPIRAHGEPQRIRGALKDNFAVPHDVMLTGKQNKQGRSSCPAVHLQLTVSAHLSEALAAENRTVGLGLEGNLGLAAATGASSGEELTGTAGSVLASITASLAALGLVLEAALCVELLLTGGEYELVAALFAN